MYTDKGERNSTNPGCGLPEETVLEILEGPRYVSRGGEKLEAALEAFSIPLAGRTALDAGASTGGFTDCLLQHGVARVYAVDVGYGQLAWRLRQDPRVVVMERTNVRHLAPEAFPETPDLFTADCSFISLRLVLPGIAAVVTEQAQGIVLVKPQFEAGRHHVGRGGVVRDQAVHQQVVEQVLEAAQALGFSCAGVIPSPLRGPAGNREFLAHLRREGRAGGSEGGSRPEDSKSGIVCPGNRQGGCSHARNATDSGLCAD